MQQRPFGDADASITTGAAIMAVGLPRSTDADAPGDIVPSKIVSPDDIISGPTDDIAVLLPPSTTHPGERDTSDRPTLVIRLNES